MMLRAMVNQVAKWLGESPPEGITPNPEEQAMEALASPHMLSGLLPYEAYDVEHELFLNKKTTGFVLESNTLLGCNEQTENILLSLLTDIIPVGVDIQFICWASPKVGPMLDLFVAARGQHDMLSWLARQRADYLAHGAYESLIQSGTALIRNFRLFLVFSHKGKGLDIISMMHALKSDIQSTLSSVQMHTSVFSPQAFINTFSDLVVPTTSLYPDQQRWNQLESLSLQLGNPEYRMHIESNHLRLEGEAAELAISCLSVRDFPEKASQWRMSENLGQIFNSTLQLPCPCVLSLHVQKQNRDQSASEAQVKFIRREAQAKTPVAKLRPELHEEFQDWQLVRDRLQEGDVLVKVFYQVVVMTTMDKLPHHERRIRDLYLANGWKLKKDSYLQAQSWLASLPMMGTEGMLDDLKTFGRLKTMTAFNALSIAPLQGEWTGTKTASMLLPGRRGQLATWLPFDNPGGNFNMAIAASSGSGKSVFTQEYVSSILGQNGMVWIIDVGHSYEKTCHYFGGEFIEFTNDNPICLNPFTTIININESLEVLKPLFATMARPITGTNEEELSFLEQGIWHAWKMKQNSATITDVVAWLESQKGAQKQKICQGLATTLFPYTCKGMYGHYFEGEANLKFDNPLVVLELQELKTKKDLQRIVLLLLIFQISNSLYFGGRERIKTCIIDEAWSLLDSDDPQTAQFIETGYRTARRYRANFVTITQAIIDYQKNAMSKAAYACSDFKVILRQTSEAINAIKQEQLMDLSPFEEKMLKDLKVTKDYSELVIKGPEGMSLHRLLLDPFSRILFSTKGEEYQAVQDGIKCGLSMQQAIMETARRFGHV